MERTNEQQKKWFSLFECLTLCVILATAFIHFLQCKEDTPKIWYVEKGFEDDWARILREAKPPEHFAETRVWNGEAIPQGNAILITTKPWQNREKQTVYYRLSYDLAYEGAIALAVDPWMVFRKQTDPALTTKRIYSAIDRSGGSNDGVLLIPGKDLESVQAWTTRLRQTGPGVFSSQGIMLFDTNLFPQGMQTYNWQDVFFRLLGNEMAWVYAPLSTIRHYQNFHKSILAATPFPEPYISQRSIQAILLWAVLPGSPEEQKKMEPTIAWLKKPKTQTVIADYLGWIPADPYGKPYDPISLASHRAWLTAAYVYEVGE